MVFLHSKVFRESLGGEEHHWVFHGREIYVWMDRKIW